MLEVLHIGGEVGGDEALAAGHAFVSFTAYADRLNRLAALTPSGIKTGVSVFTEDDEKQASVRFRGAIKHLADMVDHLTVLAPRQQNEPKLPKPEEIPTLPLFPKSS